ncbi:Lysine-specific demethylase 9 [Saguinus oedipus]|uniref:Lysine-specific demethylase 9 n=1 Tax=Saguinus oedipus TaxID=9490 RepID=A0ABQ9VC95_SAGOE|nr:Lysine-specific demethylase 9 [Saguinus oedipus]
MSAPGGWRQITARQRLRRCQKRDFAHAPFPLLHSESGTRRGARRNYSSHDALRGTGWERPLPALEGGGETPMPSGQCAGGACAMRGRGGVRAVAAQEEPDKEGKEKPHAGVSPRGQWGEPPLAPPHRRRRSRQHPGPLPPTNAAPTVPGPVEPLLLPPPPPPSLAPAGPAVAAPLPAPSTSALFTFSPLTHKGYKERHKHHHHRGSDGDPSSCGTDLKHKDKQENGERTGG